MTGVRRAFLACLGPSFLLAQPARADQVHFTGTTTASETLIRDTLQTILRTAYLRTRCAALSSVDAAILSPGYRPKDSRYRVGEGKRTYERWSVVLCGKTIKYLITFWPAADGGTMFSIGDPYPPDAP